MHIDDWAVKKTRELAARGTDRQLTTMITHGATIKLAHEDRWLINLGSNDYLGLATNQELRETFVSDGLMTSSSSRHLTGTSPSHTRAEQLAGQYWGRPTIIANSGWHANVGILQAIGGPNVLVITDREAHASILDGIRLSQSIFRRYRHQDLDHLALILERYARQYPRVIVVTESVFSMDGSITDVRQLVALCRQHPNVAIMMDEAHALAVYGPQGRGVVFGAGVQNNIDIIVGPLGKSMASIGAFIGTSPQIYNYLVATLRPLIFSTALPAMQMDWTAHVVQFISGHPSVPALRKRLGEISEYVAGGIGETFEMDIPPCAHIIPFIVGSNERARELHHRMLAHGVYTQCIRPPTVANGTARLRLNVRPDLSDGQVEHILTAFRKVKEEVAWEPAEVRTQLQVGSDTHARQAEQPATRDGVAPGERPVERPGPVERPVERPAFTPRPASVPPFGMGPKDGER